MNIRHEQFVESIRRNIKDDSASKSFLTKLESGSEVDSFAQQEELERRFEEIFGAFDSDD